jgi:hypothetical protein
VSTLGFLLEKKYWNLYDGGSSRGIVSKGKHDPNKFEPSSSKKKPELKKTTQKFLKFKLQTFKLL